MTTVGQITVGAELAGMTRGETGELLGDPAFPLFEDYVPHFLSLQGDKLFWDMRELKDEAGNYLPLAEIKQSEVGQEALDEFRMLGADREVDANETIEGFPPDRTSTKGMLDTFLRIGDGNDVLRFVERWGIFKLCRHDLPMNTRRHNSCKPHGWPNLLWEPVNIWLRYVRQAKA